MPLIIQRPKPAVGSDMTAVSAWIIDALSQIIAALTSLVTLDSDLRAQRTTVAERGVLFEQAAVTNAAVVQFQALIPSVVVEDYTTALIAFDETSGPGRYRFDGAPPTIAVGMPIPTNGTMITLVGALNIRSFQVIAETATALNMSVTLFK